MKKSILLLGLLCMGFQCGEYNPIVNYGEWWVKNATSQTIIIRAGHNNMRPLELVPGASIQFSHKEFHIYETPDFASLVERWNEWADQNISFEVLSVDGTPLMKWNYTESDSPGRQFFNESTWERTQVAGERVDEIKVRWMFEIANVDILQPE